MTACNLVIIFCSLLAFCFADDLLMVHMVWRHGDRSPSGTFKSDPYNENSWPQKYGELSLKGMSRHTKLGKLIKKMYIEDLKFLNKGYRSDEMYVRSTDLNRTIISAMSNLIGMYYSNETRAGIDYPDEEVEWPQHFIPIAVHTVEPNTDHMLNPVVPCRRHQWLWSNVMNTPEYLKLQSENEQMVANLSRVTGVNVTVQTMWFVYDIIWNELLNNRSTVIDKEYFVRMEKVKKLVDNMAEGLNISDYDGINLRLELAKVRGGGILWDIINHFDQKLYCNNASNKEKPECKWISTLKYYVYSGHDTTISALLSTLGAKEKIIPLGGPFYGAAIAIELWRLGNGNTGLKIKFYQEDDAIEGARNFTGTGGVFRDVTSTIEGYFSIKPNKLGNSCETSNGYCLYDSFRKRAEAYYPGKQEVLCEDAVSKQTNMWTTQAPPTATPTTSSGIDRFFKRNSCVLFFLLHILFASLQS